METVLILNNTLSPVIDIKYRDNCKLRPSKQQFIKEINDFMKFIIEKYKKI